MIYILPSKAVGQPDILAFSTTECSNCEEAKMYYIKNGELAGVKTKTSTGTYKGMGYTARPKVIGKNLYQTMDYSNAEDAGFYFKTYSFNPNTGIMTHVKTKSYINN